MIARYAQPEMAALFSLSKKYELFLEVECAVLKAKEEENLVPSGVAEKIKKRVRLDIKAIEALEKELRHDVLSFVKHVNSQIGSYSSYFHAGLTSYDIVDTALSLQLKQGCQLLQRRIKKLLALLQQLGEKHRNTMMMGRTHGMFAEPVSFGQKLALFYSEWLRNLKRLQRAQEEISYGKISGAVGNYAHLSPSLEKKALRFLGLQPAPVSSQVLQRDLHAYLLAILAILGGSCEKMALEVRLRQRSEIEELEEPFYEKQRGSSAMPHKRNPHVSERLCSLARLLRGYASVALENIALWEERDLTNSANERFLFSHSFILLDYMLKELTEIYAGLKVNEDRMLENIEKALGLYASQKVMLALMKKGWDREKAYAFVQALAFEAKDKALHLKSLLLEKKEWCLLFSPAETEALFSLEDYQRFLPEIYKKVGWRWKKEKKGKEKQGR